MKLKLIVKVLCLLMASCFFAAAVLAAPTANNDELNQNGGFQPSNKETTINVENPDRSMQRTITGIITNFFGRFSSIFGIPSPPQDDFVPSRDLQPATEATDNNGPSEQTLTTTQEPTEFTMTNDSSDDEQVDLQRRQRDQGPRGADGPKPGPKPHDDDDRRPHPHPHPPTKPPGPTTLSPTTPSTPTTSVGPTTLGPTTSGNNEDMATTTQSSGGDNDAAKITTTFGPDFDESNEVTMKPVDPLDDMSNEIDNESTDNYETTL